MRYIHVSIFIFLGLFKHADLAQIAQIINKYLTLWLIFMAKILSLSANILTIPPGKYH